MKYSVVECDGCGKNIYKNRYYHEIVIDFKTWIKDPNTNQSEMDASMCRKTTSLYCDVCFDRLIGHIENFTSESEKIQSENPIGESGFNEHKTIGE